MENFKETFVAEARESIIVLEEILLTLEHDTGNKEQIQEVFRVMHSLKGGAGMFGFVKIEELTHHLETIYDLIRDDEMEVTPSVLNVTLKTVDHFSALLVDVHCEIEENKQNHQIIQGIIDEILADISIKGAEESKEEKNQNILKTYFLSIEFDENIFLTGTNPLYLIEDLLNHGEGLPLANMDKIPAVSSPDFNPLKCYASWNIVLATTSSINEIEEVFIFVEEETTLKVEELCTGSLLANEDLLALTTLPIEEFPKALRSVASKYRQTAINEQKNKINSINTRLTKASSIRVSTDKLDDLMNLVSELVTTQASLGLFSEQSKNDRLTVITENMEKLSLQLRDTAFSMTLVPLSTIFYRFQRLIRDLSTKLGKEVNFTVQGGETELDKTIIEALTDPIMHLLRNCLDHGIEDNQERLGQGKDEVGTISLNAYYSGTNVHIEINDNGRGLNPAKIRAKAIENQLISETQEYSEQEILNLIFKPGFSTADEVSDVSGRGVGMDVVQRNISNLRGEVNLSSVLGQGTTVKIVLPLTLSVVDGLLVRVGPTNFVVPLTVVEKCHETNHSVLEESYNNLITVDGLQIPYCYLRSEFEIKGECPKYEQVIILNCNETPVGIVVDEIIGGHQAVLKPLGRSFKDVQIVSGATILGDGTIALVLDANRLVKDFAQNFQKNLVVEELD